MLGGYLPSTANENSKQIFVLIVFGICRSSRPIFLIERGIEVVSVVCNGDFVSDYCVKSLCLMFRAFPVSLSQLLGLQRGVYRWETSVTPHTDSRQH